MECHENRDGYAMPKPLTKPTACKGVLFIDDHVVLARNHRAEWELPGGQPEEGESPEETVAREIEEEVGVDAEVGMQLLVEDFEVVRERVVRIVAMLCTASSAGQLSPSDEHVGISLFAPDDLPGSLPRVYRRAIRFALAAREQVAATNVLGAPDRHM